MAKLTDLSVSFLSLVKTPATGKGLTLKAADGERPAAFDLVVKNDDMMRAYGVVYAPDQEDAHGDTADADTIRKAQAEFMREGRLKNIDTEHSFTSEMAYVAESWLVRKGDPLFPDEPEGSWAVGIQIGDPDLWKQLKSGELTGISLAGIARMEPGPDDPAHPRYTEKDAAPGWVERFIKALTGVNPQEPVEETDMTKDEVQALVGETLKSVLPDALKDAMKTAGDPPAKEEPTEVEKAVAAVLKAHGIEPKEPAAGEGEGDQTDIQKAVDEAVTKALGTKVDDAITKALAKGVTETDPTTGATEESFA
ncbi:MAG: XkdF-like putative serine protease domain-containing protein [Paracoccaceae bacterium]